MTHNPGDENPAVSAAAAYPSYRLLAENLKTLPITVAAPSFISPGTVAHNCALIDGLFPEMALCLFETAACLRYGDHNADDLPADPSSLSLSFHAHLPLDLPWDEGPAAAARAALGVAAAVDRLGPHSYVLHPPATPGELEAFTRAWAEAGRAPGALLLENIRGNDLRALLPALQHLTGPSSPGADAAPAGPGPGLCLDLGHMMAYEQSFLVDTVDWARVRMLHVNAPQPGGSKHLPLDQLDAAGRALLRRLLERLAPGAVVTLEVFDERGLMRSAELLMEWMHQWNLA